MKTDSHFVSLIIPTIGRETLVLTKAALKSQTRPPDELIVIFDKFRRGQGWVRNQGFQQAKGDLIAFMDDDCVPGNEWLERMVAAIDKYNAAMVNSHYNETVPFLSEVKQHRKFPSTTRINPDDFIGNAGNVVYRREDSDGNTNILDVLSNAKNTMGIFLTRFSNSLAERMLIWHSGSGEKAISLSILITMSNISER